MTLMWQLFRRTWLALAVTTLATNTTWAFSLIGPLDTTFMTAAIGYNPINSDIGGPMNVGQGYRWNIKILYYAFDPSFLHYFGAAGSNAVVQAINILNSLPPASKINLADFPTDTRRINYQASVLGILDLKSFTLATLLEEMGLTSPERYVWTLRGKTTVAGVNIYAVIQRNFDPLAQVPPQPPPSVFVNDILYTYNIIDPIITGGPSYAAAVPTPLDPEAVLPFSAVVSASDGISVAGDAATGTTLTSGSFFTGLTRDDVGGLKYLYSKGLANAYVENLATNVVTTNFAGGGGSPWAPVNPSGSNTVVTTALRPGVDKIIFKLARNDSVFGNFITISNTYQDAYYTNSHLVAQNLERVLTAPDILFSAGDLGLDTAGFPVTRARSANFVNNAALNTEPGSLGPTAGPGNISPTVVITFNNIGPFLINATTTPPLVSEGNSIPGFVWGSFDGTTNPPVLYGTTLQNWEEVLYPLP